MNGTIVPATEYAPMEIFGENGTIDYINGTLLVPTCQCWPFEFACAASEAKDARVLNGEVYAFTEFSWTYVSTRTATSLRFRHILTNLSLVGRVVMIIQIVTAVGWTDVISGRIQIPTRQAIHSNLADH